MRTGFNIPTPLLDLLAFVLLEGRLCVTRVSISPEMRSKSKKKPPSTFSDRDESRRWREGAAAPQDAELCLEGRVDLGNFFCFLPVEHGLVQLH